MQTRGIVETDDLLVDVALCPVTVRVLTLPHALHFSESGRVSPSPNCPNNLPIGRCRVRTLRASGPAAKLQETVHLRRINRSRTAGCTYIDYTARKAYQRSSNCSCGIAWLSSSARPSSVAFRPYRYGLDLQDYAPLWLR